MKFCSKKKKALAYCIFSIGMLMSQENHASIIMDGTRVIYGAVKMKLLLV